MEKLTEILATGMGGYAAYVWPAFLVTAAVMAAMAVFSLRGFARARRRLAQFSAADEA